MDLASYIKKFPRSRRGVMRRKIAKALGVKEIFVRAMCNGNKKIPAKHAIPIEKITEGQVRRCDISPNLYPEDE